MKIRAYKVWLIVSILAVVIAVVATALFSLSVPEGCSACGMAAVGLVPFWLLAFLALIINVIVIPVVMKKHSHEFTHSLRVYSWVILGLSAAALLVTILLMIFNF